MFLIHDKKPKNVQNCSIAMHVIVSHFIFPHVSICIGLPSGITPMHYRMKPN